MQETEPGQRLPLPDHQRSLRRRRHSGKTWLGTPRGVWDMAVPQGRLVEGGEEWGGWGVLVLRVLCPGAAGPSKVRHLQGVQVRLALESSL